MTRILVVEDDEDTRDALALSLELEGHEVTATGLGKAAIALAQARCFDVVLSDVGLPDVDGWTVAKMIKRHSIKPCRIVLITGWTSQMGRAIPEVHCVRTKPVDLGDLLRLVRA